MPIPFGSVAARVYERNMGRWSRQRTGSLTFALARRFPSGAITGLDVSLVLNFISNAEMAVREMVRDTQAGGTVAATSGHTCAACPRIGGR